MIKVDVKKAIKLVKENNPNEKINKSTLASMIGVHHQLLTDLENKEAPKQLCYMYKLAKLAGVNINDLIIEDE